MAGENASKRDTRIDVMRGLALLMIYVDHIPRDLLNWVTLHDFGFCDAAEVFVLLAGFSSLMAYGRGFERDGAAAGLWRIAVRCARIYTFQIGLLLLTLALVALAAWQFGLQPTIMAPMLASPAKGIARAMTLRALPSYLDILPLYIALLTVFPLIYLVLRKSVAGALCLSAMVWIAANIFPKLDLPNWIDHKGWYFNPFAWQFLFTIGSALAIYMLRRGGSLPRHRWLVAACWAFLAFAFLEAAPWHDWHLPSLRLFDMDPPDKSRLAPLRIVDILALGYVVLSDERLRRLSRHWLLRPIEAAGKHSLEVFSLGCLLALIARLAFRLTDDGWIMQIVINTVGPAMMCGLGLALERNRAGRPAALRVATAGE